MPVKESPSNLKKVRRPQLQTLFTRYSAVYLIVSFEPCFHATEDLLPGVEFY